MRHLSSSSDEGNEFLALRTSRADKIRASYAATRLAAAAGNDRMNASLRFSRAMAVDDFSIKFKNISYSVKKSKKNRKIDQAAPLEETKNILRNATGMFRAGRLTAIMGPSGAGKTSLLDILAGNPMKGKVSGTILMNGTETSSQEIRSMSGFVFQDVLIMETMTVREAIEMSAILRLSDRVPKDVKVQLVDDMLALMDLTKCQNTIIGGYFSRGISGGELKRTSVAMELIARPQILFLDEPTTGLDTFNAFSVVRSLSNLAQAGQTVVATIHQPSSETFAQFDDLILIMDGAIIFCGSRNEMITYFSKLNYQCPEFSNPADYLFMEVVGTCSEGEKQRLEEAWVTSPHFARILKPAKGPRPDGALLMMSHFTAGRWAQFLYLSRRSMQNVYRNPYNLWPKVFETLYFGIVLGLIYINSNSSSKTIIEQNKNKSGALFALTTIQFFISFSISLQDFYLEKMIAWREHLTGYYSVSPYYWSKLITQLPSTIIGPFVKLLICYYMIGLNPSFSTYLLSATYLSIAAACGVSMGIFTGSLVDDFQVLTAIVPLVTLPILLYSGIYAVDVPWYLRWIRYVSPVYWAYSGMMRLEFDRILPNCEGPPEVCSGTIVLDSLEIPLDISLGAILAIMGAIFAAFAFSAWLLLKIRLRRK